MDIKDLGSHDLDVGWRQVGLAWKCNILLVSLQFLWKSQIVDYNLKLFSELTKLLDFLHHSER